MQVQVINNCQGPHMIHTKRVDKALTDLIVFRPGLNLVNSEVLAELMKNPGFKILFTEKVKFSKAEEAIPNVRNFGKPMLEVGAELPDKTPLLGLKIEQAVEIIQKTLDTDLLAQWQGECNPQKNQEILKAISAQLKIVTADIDAP